MWVLRWMPCFRCWKEKTGIAGALDRAVEHYKKVRKSGLDDLAVGKPGKKLIHPQQVAKTLSDLAKDDAVFDLRCVGLPTVWAARLFSR